MKTILIKGKEYTPVSERVMAFREEHGFNGRIVTQLVSPVISEAVLFRAEVYIGDVLVSTGYSQARWDDKTSLVNRTSACENAETSAVGRALGFAGYGIIAGIASADEVVKAINAGGGADDPNGVGVQELRDKIARALNSTTFSAKRKEEIAAECLGLDKVGLSRKLKMLENAIAEVES